MFEVAGTVTRNVHGIEARHVLRCVGGSRVSINESVFIEGARSLSRGKSSRRIDRSPCSVGPEVSSSAFTADAGSPAVTRALPVEAHTGHLRRARMAKGARWTLIHYLSQLNRFYVKRGKASTFVNY